MSNTNDLLNRINNCYSSMSKGQKLLATYITDNYDKAVFLTAAKMGETVGVSESTVVRFATYLGYKGYPEFQRALEELVRNKLNSVQRMEVTYGRISQSKILETVLSADADKIKTTLEKIDHSAFEVAVSTILEAKNIYIVGIRSCAPLASFLGFYLNLMFDNGGGGRLDRAVQSRLLGTAPAAPAEIPVVAPAGQFLGPALSHVAAGKHQQHLSGQLRGHLHPGGVLHHQQVCLPGSHCKGVGIHARPVQGLFQRRGLGVQHRSCCRGQLLRNALCQQAAALHVLLCFLCFLQLHSDFSTSLGHSAAQTHFYKL